MSVHDSFEVSGQLIPDEGSGNGEGTFTRFESGWLLDKVVIAGQAVWGLTGHGCTFQGVFRWGWRMPPKLSKHRPTHTVRGQAVAIEASHVHARPIPRHLLNLVWFLASVCIFSFIVQVDLTRFFFLSRVKANFPKVVDLISFKVEVGSDYIGTGDYQI